MEKESPHLDHGQRKSEWILLDLSFSTLVKNMQVSTGLVILISF